MLCALRHPNGNDLRRRIEADDDIILRTHYTPWDIRVVYSEPQILSDLPKAEAPAPVDEALKARIERDVSFVYPYAAQTKLATKVAASALAAEPVSYTHLDVYKRQVQNHVNLTFRFR